MDNIKNWLHLFDNKNVYEIETALLLYEFLDKDVNDISNKEIMKAYEIVHSQDEVFDEYVKDSIKSIVDQNKNLDISIKEWYISHYPNDSIGNEISSCTFLELNNFLESKSNNDTYNLLGCNDSIVRERCFQKLSKLTHQSYSDIYQKWISKVNDRQEEYDEIEKEWIILKIIYSNYLNYAIINIEKYIGGECWWRNLKWSKH